ncbi:MAG: NUDIX hydrolase [Rhodospirillaceae bacterium]|nr:NUDIX hydrolase [Rhodospirillaceae bacterium]
MSPREYPDRPFVGVGVVILGPDGVVMIQRGNPPRKGSWSLPGGAQELGETVNQSAIREAHEETGLEIEVIGLVDVVDSIRTDDAGAIQYHYTLVDVAARTTGGTLSAGGDAMDAKWIALNEISAMGLWSETVRIVEMAAEMAAAMPD